MQIPVSSATVWQK